MPHGVVGGAAAEVVEAEGLEDEGGGVDGGVAGDAVGGHGDEGAGGEEGTVGEVDGGEDFAVETDCLGKGQGGIWLVCGF